MILPPFFKHNRNDPSIETHDQIVQPDFRINLENLKNTISTADFVDYSEPCSGKINAAFLTGRNFCKYSRLNQVSKFLGFRTHENGTHSLLKTNGWVGYLLNIIQTQFVTWLITASTWLPRLRRKLRGNIFLAQAPPFLTLNGLK